MLDFLSLNTNIPLLPIFIILQLDHIILYLMGLVRRNNNNTANRTLSTDRYSRRQTCIHCPGEIGGGRYRLQRHLPPLQTHLHSSPVRQSISFSVRGRAHVPEMVKMCIICMYQTGRGAVYLSSFVASFFLIFDKSASFCKVNCRQRNRPKLMKEGERIINNLPLWSPNIIVASGSWNASSCHPTRVARPEKVLSFRAATSDFGHLSNNEIT